MSRPSPTHAAAIEYATRQGWFVFPVQPPAPGDAESGKRPLTPNGKDDATTDVATIDYWWTQWPDANVGIACEPSGLVVLDIDIGVGKKGAESLAEFDAKLPQTLTATTGSGGLHAVYKKDDLPALQKIGFRDGLDLIGKGYIVAAPSLHYTGGQYRWRDVRPLVPLPKILRDAALAGKPQRVQTTPAGERSPIEHGGRNNALFKLGAALRDSGIGKEALASALHFENQQRCKPPVSDDELKLIIDSVLRRVVPTRDVAASAVVEQEIHAAVAPEQKSFWLHEVAQRDEPPMRFYETGFEQLDVLLGGGVATRQVTGVIGTPSSGKSAFMNCLVEKLQTQLPVLLVSTELPKFELYVRFAALRMNFPWRDGIKGLVKRDHMQQAVHDLRVRVIGSDDIDRLDALGSVRREAELMRAANGGISPVIVVDYVQMLARGQDEVRQRVGELSMGLRIMSQDLDCPVLAVFSSRRDFYGGSKMDALREGDDPTAYLVAAKESGDIEFDCATLLFLDVDKTHEGLPKPARIVVTRCRHGSVGFAGARAALDVGRWWGDASAVGEMTQENKKVQRHLSTLEADQARILEVVMLRAGRPWKDLVTSSGIPPHRANAARSKLFETGKLEYVKEHYYDSMKRLKTRDIMKVTGNAAPPPFVPVEGEEP
jgi:hypothetical protein